MNEEENSNGKDAVKLAPSILAADFARVLERTASTWTSWTAISCQIFPWAHWSSDRCDE
jgi:hypothetical protein